MSHSHSEGLSEYAQGGVNYKLIEPFKAAVIKVAKKTVEFPNRRRVHVDTDLMHAHGGVFEYFGGQRHAWCKTHEGLGNKSWIADLMYAKHPEGRTYHDVVAYDTVMMAANDCLAQGALPVILTDEVAASDSDWFADQKRAREFGDGLFEACRDAGMALVAGESPVYKYLINPRPPVRSVAVFSANVTGLIAPIDRKITGAHLRPGDIIMAAASSGIHANGVSGVIQRVMGNADAGIDPLPDGFDTKLPSGMTIGEAVHIKTLCYVPLIEDMLEAGVDIHALLPGTGSGVAKLGFDARFRYRIHSWLPVHELFLKMQDLGMKLTDCLETFNWGAGYYIFVPRLHVNGVLDSTARTGFTVREVGIVEEGKCCTIFGPANDLVLPPPGH